MKTEKSNTKRKLDELTLGFIGLVRDFTYKELYDILRNSKEPLIYELNKNEIAVGRYIIQRQQNFWAVMTHLADVDHVFQSKIVAIVYCIVLLKNNLNLARKIVDLDNRVLLNRSEMNLYKTKLSEMTPDEFKQELYAAKYTNSKIKYTIAKEELEKTLNLAKYLKLGT
jgi:hypothetical protein